MPRSVRVEFSGALYHVMARGNSRADIFLDDDDREIFLRTLGQACERTGWQVLAWVLMSNHYHLALRTPEPNLVAGMTWLQNTYTRRFNCRHQNWGRLFGDRYKAVPVETTDGRLVRDPIANRPADYLTVLLDYIHLNPIRAKLIRPERNQSILDFPWSSIARGYALPPTKRDAWLDVETGLSLVQCRDVSRDRRRYVERLDRRAASEEAERCGLPEVDSEKEADGRIKTLRRDLRRGWYWGSDAFREKLLDQAGTATTGNPTYRSSEMGRDHGERLAQDILSRAVVHFGVRDEAALANLNQRGNLVRMAVAWAIWRSTSVSQAWIADQLNLRSAGNVSQQVRRFDQINNSRLPPNIRQWKRDMRESLGG